jgi:hypothetical protein
MAYRGDSHFKAPPENIFPKYYLMIAQKGEYANNNLFPLIDNIPPAGIIRNI